MTHRVDCAATVETPGVTNRPETGTDTALLPLFNVVLLNDDDHTYAYVIEMLREVCGHPIETGYRMAEEVDRTGRVIVFTGHQELAELRQSQIHDYGPDPRLPHSRASMRAILEPARKE